MKAKSIYHKWTQMNTNKTKICLCSFVSIRGRVLVVLPTEVRAFSFTLFAGLAFFLFGSEASLLVSADAAVGVKTFQHEFRGGGADGIRFVGGEAESLGFFHEP